MDETLPDTLHMTSIYLMILLTSLAIVASGIPVYVCMIGALFLSFFMMQVRGGGVLWDCCGCRTVQKVWVAGRSYTSQQLTSGTVVEL